MSVEKSDLQEYVRERFEQAYENLPLRQAVIIECDFCEEMATQTDETEDETIIYLCDEHAELAQQSLEEMWQAVED